MVEKHALLRHSRHSLQTSAGKLADIQAMHDSRNVAIRKAGVQNLRYPVRLHWENGNSYDALANFNLTCNLSPEQRGVHMSRFVELVEQWHNGISWKNLAVLAEKLETEIVGNPDSKDSFVTISCDIPYFKKKTAPVSRAKSTMDYDCSFEFFCTGGKIASFFHLTVPVMTLCPCSREISESGAHNQRSRCKLILETRNEPNVERLIETVESSASSPLYAVLKRSDERVITEHSYNNPSFVEDLLRNVVIFLRKEYAPAWFSVEVISYESIHNHNAYAYTEEGKRTI